MTQTQIDRLNALARKHKAEGLDEAEQKERAALRADYLAAFRNSLSAQLDNIYLVDADGKQEKLRKKEETTP